MKHFAILACLVIAACSPAPEASNVAAVENTATPAVAPKLVTGPEVQTPAKRYADATAAYNSFARASATLGKTKASSAAVKKYAEMVYKEQLQFGMDFKLAAGGVPGLLPNTTLTPEQQENIETLQQASGTAFDQAFVSQQVAAHAKAMPVQQAYGTSGDEPDLKAFADRYSRWVQRHLRLGKEL
jgi:putative membrane protein